MKAVTLDTDAGLKWTDESEEGWVSKDCIESLVNFDKLQLVLLEEKRLCRKNYDISEIILIFTQNIWYQLHVHSSLHAGQHS